MISSKRNTHTLPTKAVDEVHKSGKRSTQKVYGSTRRSTHNKHTDNTQYTDYTHIVYTHNPEKALDEIHKSTRRNTQKHYTKHTKALDEVHKRFFKPLKNKGKSGGEKLNTFNTIKTFKGTHKPPP